MKTMEHELGTGQLSWMGSERRTDRYGTVALWEDATPYRDDSSLLLKTNSLTGKHGKLVATVLETRKSSHIGDLFHGYTPGSAEVGKTYQLGVGTLFEEEQYGSRTVGLKPDDGRNEFWLDPKQLYIVHQQTVRLVFIEDA